LFFILFSTQRREIKEQQQQQLLLLLQRRGSLTFFFFRSLFAVFMCVCVRARVAGEKSKVKRVNSFSLPRVSAAVFLSAKKRV